MFIRLAIAKRLVILTRSLQNGSIEFIVRLLRQKR